MIKFRLLLLVLILKVASAQSLPFAVGERLEYTARFNVLPVGEAQLVVEASDTINGVPTMHVSYQARTGEVADRLYRIRDRIDIWFSRDDLKTYRVVKDINEGKYRKHRTTRIDYDNLLAITNNDTLPIAVDIRDPYSLFYYLRTLPLADGQILDLTTFDNKKFTSFQVKITAKQKVKVPAGRFSCLLVKPFHRQRTLFKNQGDMEIWLSDDDRKIPVQINIKLKYGSLILKLKRIG